MTINIFDSISSLPSIGPKTTSTISNMCGGVQIIHILLYFPSNVQYIKPIHVLKDTQSMDGDNQDPYMITVTVIRHQHLKKFHIIYATDGDNTLEIFYFHGNAGYLKKLYPINETVTIWGKITKKQRYQMVHPTVVRPEDLSNTHELYQVIYSLKDISKQQWTKIIHHIFENLKPIPEWLPHWVIEKYNLPSFIQALFHIHHPKNKDDLNKEHAPYLRLAFDEFLSHQSAMQKRKLAQKTVKGSVKQGDAKLIKSLLKLLPFSLTHDQKQTTQEILHDMKTPTAMVRVLQGDVGSGKTVVALIASLWAYTSGYQTAFMAPTEILAKQHYKLFHAYATQLSLKVALLTGGEKKATRDYILEKTDDGSLAMLIGTHALIQQDIRFQKLGLVIIDEQHRFGVKQRSALIEKGIYTDDINVHDMNVHKQQPQVVHPDLLFTTATPIPRTLMMTYLGDMDVSQIKTKPLGRKSVITKILSQERIQDLIEALKPKILDGEQIFWVCPRVMVDDKSHFISVEERYQYLCDIIGKDYVSMIHGQMSGANKMASLNAFSSQKTKILVATTVIEVGIDIPSANIMIIEHAEQFGLAQLHQLRGRIGRGSTNGVCFLVYRTPLSSIAQQRLTLLRSCDDGFVIADKDWELRGGGDLLGTRQSGFIKFYCVDWGCHKKLMPDVKKSISSITMENKNILEQIFLESSSLILINA